MNIFTKGWESLNTWFTTVKVKVSSSALESHLEVLGADISKAVADHIRSQDLKWAKLSAYTIYKKGHDKIYLDSWEYVRSIRAKVEKSATSATLTVSPEGNHKKSGLSMQDLARILEYGDVGLPARPLWRPTFEELRSNPKFKPLKGLMKSLEFR